MCSKMEKVAITGKSCLICMNVLLLILGALVAGFAFYVMYAKDVPPVFEIIKSNCLLMMFGGIALVIFAIVGFCASCGGCILYLYCIIITLLTVVFLVIDIVLFVIFTDIKTNKISIIDQIDNGTITVITNPDYAEEWKSIQDNFKCCGYNNIIETRTGDVCPVSEVTESPVVDCKALLIDACSDYSLYAAIVCLVVFIVLLILTWSSCKRWKDDDCC